MPRDPLQTLVNLVATEPNPHQLLLRVVSDSVLLKELQRFCRKIPGVATAGNGRIKEYCRSYKILPEYFQERVRLIGRILSLIPYELNYYETLLVSRSASREEIKRAYRRLSLLYHPDTNPDDPNAAERFRNIQNAYEILSDDKLRQSYDLNVDTRSWTEAELPGGGAAKFAWWGKWRSAWPAAVLFLLFMLAIFVIDYEKWQTERYYENVQQPSAQKAADSSPPPPSPVVKPAREPAREVAPSPPAAPLAESLKTLPTPVQPAAPPQPSSTEREMARPLEAAPSPNLVAKSEGPSPEADTLPSRDEKLAAPPAVSPPIPPAISPQVLADAKQALPKPLAASSPSGGAPAPAGKPEGRSARPEARPAEPVRPPSTAQLTTPTAKPETTPAPEQRVRAPEVDKEIRMFLSRYASTYETRNLPALLRLFEPDALENGKPIQELVPVYETNFRRAEKLHYRINVGRLEVGEDGVKVDGSFSLSVQFLNEAPIESTGSIQLTLVRRGGDFGVKRMNYSFSKSRTISD